MEIVIDDRESYLIKEFQLRDLNYLTKRLVQGDILLRDDQYEIYFERKTFNDLWMSIRDGRYREQRSRYLEIRNTHQKIIYIIEGTPTHQWDNDIIQQCYRVIDRLQIAYDIPVVFTDSISKTTEYIHTRYMYLTNLSSLFKISNNSIKNQLIKPKLKNQDLTDPCIFLINTLCLIPRISFEMASAIVSVMPEHNRSIKSMIEYLSNITTMENITYRSSLSNKEHKITKTIFLRLRHILGITTTNS